MSLASYSLKNTRVSHFVLVLSVVGGMFAFGQLGKQEDAPFIIKQAVVSTAYPGASAEEVERQITEIVEREVQTTRGVEFLKSESLPGVSIVNVYFFEDISGSEFNQIWDELRRKVENVKSQLPEGASDIVVNDDFGDVFGVYYAVTATDGYTDYDLEKFADFIKRELVTIGEVSKVELYGVQKRVVNIDISNAKLANAGVNPMRLINTLQSQNKLIRSGDAQTGEKQIRLNAEGTFQNLTEIENLIVEDANGNQIRLKDLATVSMGYVDPPTNKMRMNGATAIGIGISNRAGGNSIVMGEDVDAKMEYCQSQLPVGIDIQQIYAADKVAIEANNNFILNLIISVATVVLIILFAMGVRAGILIGTSLIFTILSTLLFMLFFGVDLHRTSLAAIIIAMGMLVDNAIVVTDNAQNNMKRGLPKKQALLLGAQTPQWGLLGATFIAIISFLPLYLAPSNVAEVIKPLFIVLAISLTLSWVFAMMQTTVYGEFILKEPKKTEGDLFDNKFYRSFRNFLEKAIRFRWATILMVVGVFALSLFAYRYVKQAFFPAINKAMFKVDYFMPQGTSIEAVESDIKIIEQFLLQKEEVKNVSITIGSTPLRYYLASVAWTTRPNLAHIVVETESHKVVADLMLGFESYLKQNYPESQSIFYKFKVSPQPEATIEANFKGPNMDTLRMLSEQAKAIMRNDSLCENIRDSWGEKTMEYSPVYDQLKGQSSGVSRDAVAQAMRRLTIGTNVGVYREDKDVIPIVVKDADRNNYNFANIGALPIFNNRGETILLGQVIDSVQINFEESRIKRHNRQRSISAQCDPIWGVENVEVEKTLVPLVEAIPLPVGYELWWDGIKWSQERSQAAIKLNLPLAFILMLGTLIFLFNSYRKTLIIFLIVPLMVIGIVLGFLLTGQYFGFFAVLGVLGLVGMVIKNAIVLIDQINIEIDENGIAPYEAVVMSAVSRIMPVSMAAGTTILGMIPLLPDPMFGGMAATIMGGLLVATVLTLIVLPVFYATIYKLKK
ncbi:MAG: efflux RND transporter permease subunit [Bacteroidetes bacterium]|nr:efflux RND transporter permease subunit [Bacteroidota bacterium]